MSLAARGRASAVVVTLVLLTPLVSSGPSAAPGDTFSRWCAVSRLPGSVVHRYTLSVRVRPLLFWITRNNVGDGRVARGEGPNGARSIELLIGSDPHRTPMSVNRWGYIMEVNRGNDGELLGVMTESDEKTVQEATTTIGGPSAGQHLKAIRARVEQGAARAQVIAITSGKTFTYRDVDAVLRELPEGGSATAALRVPAGTSPGFLCAVSDLMRATVVEESRHPSDSGASGRASVFVYDRSLYDLKLVQLRRVSEVRLGTRTYSRCLESEFQVRNRTTGKTSSFRVTYGISGSMAEVPVRIVYRPRWWFEAELTLEEGQ